MIIRKTFDIEVKETRKNGGQIVISTGSVDRDRDRVMPTGAAMTNYMKNPVVQWGHNYRDPWATVGKTNNVNQVQNGLAADFDLRPAANDQDPQNVVLLLWNGGWVRTASIGFQPIKWVENDMGGRDYTEWELLEWSLVPVPANQDALRLAAKAFGDEPEGAKTVKADCQACGASGEYSVTLYADLITYGIPVLCQDCYDGLFKRGRVLSGANEQRLRDAAQAIQDVLAQLGDEGTEAAEDIEPKAAIPYKKLPLAPQDAPWDGPAQMRDADPATLKIICAWFNAEAPDVKQSYKLPHHLAAGEHQTVWRGVTAAMGALLGARGGMNIPDGDRRGVYNHLASHYKDFEETAPDFKQYSEDELKTLFPELYQDQDEPITDDAPAQTDDGRELSEQEQTALAVAIGKWVEAAKGLI